MEPIPLFKLIIRIFLLRRNVTKQCWKYRDVENNLGDCANKIENGVDVENDLVDCPSNVENGLDVKNILCDCDWKPKLGMSFNSKQVA